MKQGRASSSGAGSQKREPVSHAVDPGAVSQIGCHVGEPRAVKQLYAGRGYEAPVAKATIHNGGSQGEH